MGSAKIDGHLPGQERVVVFDGLRQRETVEQPSEVTIRVDAVGLAGFDQRIEIGACVRAVDGVREQPATASDDKRANGIFAGIVRYGPVAVLDVTDQLGPLRVQISQCFAEQAVGHDAGRLLERELFYAIKYGGAVPSPQSLSSLGRPLLATRFGREQLTDQFDKARRKQIGSTRCLRYVVFRLYEVPPGMSRIWSSRYGSVSRVSFYVEQRPSGG